MIGGKATRTAPRGVTAPGPSPILTAKGGGGGSSQDAQTAHHHGVLATGIFLLVVYVVWAFVETHDKVRESLKPGHIAFNVRNILLISFTAVLGIPVLKVAAAKAAAYDVPFAKQFLGWVAAS